MTRDDQFDNDKYLELVREDRDQIATAMSNVPSYFAFYGAMAERWAGLVEQLENEVDLKEAIALDEIKSSGDKITDSLAKAKVEIREEVQKAKKQLRLAREQMNLYKIAVRAFDIKSKMLSGRNAARRSEQDASHGVTHQVESDNTSSSPEEMAARRRQFRG